MKQFFKFMFASAVGFIIAGGVLLLIFFISIFGLISSLESSFASKPSAKVKENTVVHLKLDRQIVDRKDPNPFADMDLGPFSSVGQDGLNDILLTLEKAAKDDKVKGIFLELNGFPGGTATLLEVREAIEEFKESGKWVLAHSNMYSQGGYYLASAADKVYLYPEGDLTWRGLGSSTAFFKKMLDKLDVDVQIIRGGNNVYKSAVEPFYREDMSDASREQIQRLLDDISERMISDISASKNISVQNLNLYADSLKVNSGEDAFELGFVDALKYDDEFRTELMDSVKVEKEKDLNLMAWRKYHQTFSKPDPAKMMKDTDKKSKKDKVAVIYASGAIEQGSNNSGEGITAEKINKAIKKARKDSTVKAIVFRVSSPGGSALASDEIWRETVLAAEEKPFIVSMGDYAASGGYYISAAADKIFAQHSTITGSIGVFGMIPNAEGFFNNKLGITFDGVSTHEHSEPLGIYRPLTDYEKHKLEQSVERVYDTFLKRVADGRGMSVEVVDSLGMGRVWTGSDALKAGLVDELGGLKKAVQYAAEAAGIEDYKEWALPERKDPFEEFLAKFMRNAEVSYLRFKLGDEYRHLEKINEAKNMSGIQARMPIVPEVHL